MCGAAQLAEDDLAPHLAKVGDRALRHALEYGVAFLHETQPPAEQEVVNLLFNAGAIQVRPHSPPLGCRVIEPPKGSIPRQGLFLFSDCFTVSAICCG